jgi:hypothetical protein
MPVDQSNGKKSVTKFMRGLLAATCLTAASAGAAHAGTVTEVGDNFGHSFASATVLPGGTTTVIGSVGDGLNDDWFKFSGFSGAFDLRFTLTACCTAVSTVLDSTNTPIGSPSPTPLTQGSPVDVTGTAPLNGVLVVQMAQNEGSSYQVDVISGLSAAPEPGAGLLTGLGAAAGLLGLRRRKRNA